jgi:hypothetical protein
MNAILFIASLFVSPRVVARPLRRKGGQDRDRQAQLVCELRIADANLRRRLTNNTRANFGEPRTKALLICYLKALEKRLAALGIDAATDPDYLYAKRLLIGSRAKTLPPISVNYLD